MGITKTTVASLRHRITIETQARTSDGQGGYTESWSTLATVWAKIEPVSQGERLQADRLAYKRTHRIIIRYRNDITTSMQIVFGSRTFQIKSVIDFDERKAFTFIDAEENEAS